MVKYVIHGCMEFDQSFIANTCLKKKKSNHFIKRKEKRNEINYANLLDFEHDLQ